MITKEMVKEKEAESIAAAKALSGIRKQYAIQECPFRIGDKTEIKGWSHKGKIMVITNIGPAKYDCLGSWRVSGKVIKKNGEPGEQDAEFCEYHYTREGEA